MRSSKSRSRSKANRPRTLGNIINRVFDSSGPEGKVRGTPAQIIEKYQFLARDAQLSNDRVAAENFLQHAEHYTRMLAEAMREMQAEQEARQQYHQQMQGGQGNPQHGGNGNGNGNGNGFRDRDAGRDRYEPRRDERYERAGEGGSGLGPVIDAEDDRDEGPVRTPEAIRTEDARPEFRAEPRGERPRSEGPRGERSGERTGRSSDRSEPSRPERDEPRAEHGEHRPVQGAAATEAAEAPRSRAPRAQAQRGPHVGSEDQPGLPSFITGTPEPVAAEPPKAQPAERAPRSRAPRKPAAAKSAEVAETKVPD